jgi:hypothetical protein
MRTSFNACQITYVSLIGLLVMQERCLGGLILFDLTFSVVPGPLLLLASVAFKVSALVSLH